MKKAKMKLVRTLLTQILKLKGEIEGEEDEYHY